MLVNGLLPQKNNKHIVIGSKLLANLSFVLIIGVVSLLPGKLPGVLHP